MKLTFVIALLGIGSVKPPDSAYVTAYLLYLAPIVAIVLDLYIMGEDTCVKRIGRFLREHAGHGVPALEVKWESQMWERREKLTRIAGPVLTSVSIVASAAILWTVENPWLSKDLFYGAWLIVVVAAYATCWSVYRLRIMKAYEK